jgi:hypothetical protein
MPAAPAAQGALGRIRVFGGVLASDRPLPGLPVAPHAGDGQSAFWELRTQDSAQEPAARSTDLTPIGTLTYANGVVVTLAGSGNQRAEVAITDTGRFTVDHRTITHSAPPNVDREAVALDLIGVVLPYALHRDGAWCVHASAVQTPAGVIAFVAPSGTGKSTLAAACMRAGCALVADDVVVLRESPDGITVTPSGVPLRLHAATARAVGAATSGADAWGKVRVDGVSTDVTLPLAALYVLQSVAGDAPCARALRPTRAAALALMANGKITALLGKDLDGTVLTRCVSLAHRAAVYDLAVPRDLAQLGSVTDALLGWHSAPALEPR